MIKIAVIDMRPNRMAAEILDVWIPFQVTFQFLLAVDAPFNSCDTTVRSSKMRTQIELQSLAANLSNMAVSQNFGA